MSLFLCSLLSLSLFIPLSMSVYFCLQAAVFGEVFALDG